MAIVFTSENIIGSSPERPTAEDTLQDLGLECAHLWLKNLDVEERWLQETGELSGKERGRREKERERKQEDINEDLEYSISLIELLRRARAKGADVCTAEEYSNLDDRVETCQVASNNDVINVIIESVIKDVIKEVSPNKFE
ncbi:hypothetical protein CAPTEDRAFT_212035 [Capitella teleta]|uniref:Uncharacterized protein n=1 Tax=Capitella teleta TaxID=283909 RepID=R7UGS6_CAPTE|nr:hypothetical protein CAPTEDRAFT_212035 [Capitella teleta]|eukprot:ELU05303.1 hypothetical protein CAPTEDRAFT_212035 [Capitella teleta]